LPVAVKVSGGSEIDTTNDSAVEVVTLPQVPDLVVSISHTGTMFKGDLGVQYSIRVRNVSSAGPTSGLVTVTNTIPAGLTNLGNVTYTGPTPLTNWSCNIAGSTLTCTTSDVLPGLSSYSTINYTVNVASNAPSSIVNTAAVSGGGEVNTSNDSASETATVYANGPTAAVALSGLISRSAGGFIYLTVTNIGAGATSGRVTVTAAAPGPNTTVNSISGIGWSCNLGSRTCTRSDSLPAGLSYRTIIMSVSTTTAAFSTVTDSATASGGSSVNTSTATGTFTVLP
jgi:hypothetical protein